MTAPAARPPIPPLLILGVGLLAVSCGAVFVRLAAAPALTLALWRVALATLLLAPFWGKAALRELPGLTPGDRWRLAAAAALLALHFASWIASLHYTSVASSLALVNTTPLWVALLAPLVSGERVTRRQWQGVVFCLIGAAIIGAGDFRLSGTALLGDLLAVAGAFTVTGYLLLGRRLQRRLSTAAYLLPCYGGAALLLLALAWASGLDPFFGYPPPTYLWLIALALGPQLIGHSCYNWSLRWLSTVVVSIFLLGEPLLGSLLAWWVFGETPPLTTGLGGALILGGVMRAKLGAGAAAPPPGCRAAAPPRPDTASGPGS